VALIDLAELPDPGTRPQHESACIALRDAVISCRLEPGRLVTEGDLARQFGFGKTAVRLALTRLAQEGLVRSLGRRGYEITPLTIGDVNELFDVRAMLEAEAARLAIGRIDIERLRLVEQRLRDGARGKVRLGGDAETNALHTAFHLQVAAASGNQRLFGLMQAAMREMNRLLYLGLGVLPAGQIDHHFHQELIDALARHDADAAARHARAHVEGGRDMVMRALLQSPAMRQVALPTGRVA